jgi:hypothetical protein
MRESEPEKIKTVKKQNCETVKLWLQVIDSTRSTVSQFHKQAWGVGKKQGPGNRKAGNEGTREQGTE